MSGPEHPVAQAFHDTWTGVFEMAGSVLEQIAGQLTLTQLTTTVPATPDWSVADVYAHLAGVGTSVVTGAMAGAPGPEWTAAHVSSRRGQSLVDIVAELRACEPAVAEIIAGAQRPAIVWDRVVHCCDIMEALGMPPAPEPLWRLVGESMSEKQLRELPVTVIAGERTYGAGGPTVSVDPYELFRIVFSRRSPAEVAAALGEVLDTSQRDGIQAFGPRD